MVGIEFGDAWFLSSSLSKKKMRTIIVSLSLFAVVLAYILLSPSDKSTTTTSQKTIAEEKAGNEGKTTSSRSVLRKADEADWAAVHAIAKEYDPQLAELERQRDEFKDVLDQFSPDELGYSDIQGDEFEPLGIDPNLGWHDKQSAVWDGLYNTEKAIRDMEREQWSRMSEHLSPYELREYKLEHSWRARMIREKAAWMDPPLSEGEFLSLFANEEEDDNALDSLANGKFDGDRWEMDRAHGRGDSKFVAILRQNKLFEEKRAEIDNSTDPDLRFYMDEIRPIIQYSVAGMPTLSQERKYLYFHGPNSEAVVEAEMELDRVEEIRANGQATLEEVNAARERTMKAIIGETEDEFVADE